MKKKKEYQYQDEHLQPRYSESQYPFLECILVMSVIMALLVSLACVVPDIVAHSIGTAIVLIFGSPPESMGRKGAFRRDFG